MGILREEKNLGDSVKNIIEIYSDIGPMKIYGKVLEMA